VVPLEGRALRQHVPQFAHPPRGAKTARTAPKNY
jgi:hypothetical protein